MQFNIYKMKDNYDHIIEYYLQDKEDGSIYDKSFSTSRIPVYELSEVINDLEIERSSFFIKRKDNTEGLVDWAYNIEKLKENSDIKIDEKGDLDINKTVSSFYGVFLFELNNRRVYAISFGYASSLLSKYCNSNFGLDVAERILSDQSVDVESIRFLNVNRKKSLTVFSEDAVSTAEYGSAKEYIEGRIVKELFVDSTNRKLIEELLYFINNKFDFGSSIKFTDRKIKRESRINSIEDLAIVIVVIDYFINVNQNNIKLNIPRLNFIGNQNYINKELDKKLVVALEKENINVGIDFYSVIGAEVIINNFSSFTLSFTGVKSLLYEDLSIGNIIEFLNSSEVISPLDILNGARVRFESGATRALKKCLMADVFYNNQTYILVDGKWATYNDTFMKFIDENIEKIVASNIIKIKREMYSISDNDLAKYYKKSSKEIKFNYREYIYNSRLAELGNMVLLDREINLIEKYPNVEIADLLNENELIHVKIGDTGKFIENIEQSMLAATIMTEDESKENLLKAGIMDSKLNDIYTVSMILVYKDRDIEDFNLADINSIKFKASLIEWYQRVKNLNLIPKIYITNIINTAKKFSELIEIE